MSINIDVVMHTFIAESRELLGEMENALLAVARPDGGEEAVNAIFRAAHTIKGSAGMFGLDPVVQFTHVAESVLDRVRDGRLPVDDGLVAVLLGCCDHIGALVDAVESNELDGNQALAEAGAPLTAQLQAYLGAPAAAAPRAAAPVASTEAAGDAEHWHISLRFGADVLRNGMDPLSFLRYLGQLGQITGIAVLDEGLPVAEEFDPESCYLGFEIAFRSNADKAAIEGVFEFVRDDCQIRILPPHSRVSEYVQLIAQLPEERSRLGEMLVKCGSVTAHELAQALAVQSAVGAQAAPIGAILVEQGAVRPPVVDAALAKQKQAGEPRAVQESRSVRVDADKLDRLINLVGELIIAGASANVIARRTQSAELLECTSTLSSLVEEVRDSALQLRMVKIGATFNRFQRVVHDVSREIGKDIGLSVSGEDTELDKTVVEKIGDPLTHLVRNAMDHGIEAAELRAARGKPAKGRVALNAYHDSGSIVIEVSDDGGGLKKERILAKAVERGLVEAGRVAERQGNLRPDLRTRLLDRRTGDQPVRPWRRHGRGQAQYPGAARQRGDLQRGRRGHHGHRAPAAHAGHHQRLPGRAGQIGIRDPDGHGRGVHRVPRGRWPRLYRPARPGAALCAPARTLCHRRPAGAAPEHCGGALWQQARRPGGRQPARRVPDRDQAAGQSVQRPAFPQWFQHSRKRRSSADPGHGGAAEWH
jgi:two-component system chemotaxis sensor kinase CheA